MKIVVAPDKFKGCLSAVVVAHAIAAGLRSADPALEIDECPMADGGEGTVATLVADTTRCTTNDPPLTGADLGRIRSTGYQPVSSFPQITVACDVTNPLFGPTGAARIFAPQKGATPDQVDHLDRALKRLAQTVPSI